MHGGAGNLAGWQRTCREQVAPSTVAHEFDCSCKDGVGARRYGTSRAPGHYAQPSCLACTARMAGHHYGASPVTARRTTRVWVEDTDWPYGHPRLARTRPFTGTSGGFACWPMRRIHCLSLLLPTSAACTTSPVNANAGYPSARALQGMSALLLTQHNCSHVTTHIFCIDT